MCGVIGFISEAHRDDLGVVAAELLKTLEYRGYDSTGAAVQGETDEIVLRKGVGAPSLMVDELGIVGLAGSILCGQVRWATFGSVDDLNAQPHEVRCKTHIYGAHNGNVTNCDDLKAWLTAEGHDVVSDNDGEMLVHTVEHEFAAALREGGDRRAAMRGAVAGDLRRRRRAGRAAPPARRGRRRAHSTAVSRIRGVRRPGRRADSGGTAAALHVVVSGIARHRAARGREPARRAHRAGGGARVRCRRRCG